MACFAPLQILANSITLDAQFLLSLIVELLLGYAEKPNYPVHKI
jgi:hypothetical protein